jgi:hypothetical protein
MYSAICVCSLPIYRAVALTVRTRRTRGDAPARREPRGGAPPIQPSTAARTPHRQRQSPDWVTGRLTPGQGPRAPRRAWFLTWRTSAPAGAQGCATLRLSGAAHKRAQRRTDTIGTTRRARAPSPPAATARPCPAGAAPGSASDRLGRPARPDPLQTRQQPLPGMAVQEGRVMTRRQKSRDR